MSAPVLTLSSLSRPTPGGLAPPDATSPLASQLPRGRLVELTGDRAAAHLSTAVACLRHAQTLGETAAWVQPAGGPLFPPDLAECGVDLDALLVVHVPAAAGPHGLPRAAELLLRSGGFGMVVMDLGGMGDALSDDNARWGRLSGDNARWRRLSGDNARWRRLSGDNARWRRLSGDNAWQGRLLGLAREHDAWLLLLSEPSDPARRTGHASLGPLVSLRIHPTRSRRSPGCFALTPGVLKDKSGQLHALAPETRRGPWGLL